MPGMVGSRTRPRRRHRQAGRDAQALPGDAPVLSLDLLIALHHISVGLTGSIRSCAGGRRVCEEQAGVGSLLQSLRGPDGWRESDGFNLAYHDLCDQGVSRAFPLLAVEVHHGLLARQARMRVPEG